MPAETVAGEVADCLGRQRRHVLLTGVGRLAIWVRALAPWLLERTTERSFRGESLRSKSTTAATPGDQGP